MTFIIRVLPIILISIIFYLLFYEVYPSYQETINLTKKIKEIEAKENQLRAIIELLATLKQNANIKNLMALKNNLDSWIPSNYNIDELISSLYGIYNTHGLAFKGTDFRILDEEKVYNPSVLPLKVITFNLTADLNPNNIMSFINAIEKNVRIMVIKKAKIIANQPSEFYVESYYIQTNK